MKKTKKEALLEKREKLLETIGILDNVIEGNNEKKLDRVSLEKILFEQSSIGRWVEWLETFILQNLESVPETITNLAAIFEKEFPTLSLNAETTPSTESIFKNARVHSILMLYLDGPLILYVLGKNGPAIIELHGTLERKSIEKLVNLLILPDKTEIGSRIFDRFTLKSTAPLLVDSGVLDKNDAKFITRLSKLRNGIAHRNAKGISNLLLSGKKILDPDIDEVLKEVDFVSLLLRSIIILEKITEWDETID